MRKVHSLFLIVLIFCKNSYAINVIFDEQQRIAKILEINNITECSDEYMNGRITKVKGRYPSIDIYLRSNDGKTSAVQISVNEMDMVTLKALDTIIFEGSKVRTHIQRCGSGAIPFLISIKSSLAKQAKY